MSDLFKGVTFPWQEVTPSDDAIIRKAVLPDRRLSGCELSYSGYTLTMTAGVMIVCGRQFRHTAAQNWAITGATSGYARLLLTIDTTKASTEDAFEQITASIEYATAADGFPNLRQDDINNAGTVYQTSICVVALGPGGITRIVNQIIPGDDVFYPGRPVSMGGHQVKDVAAPEEDGDAVNLGYANENFAPAGYIEQTITPSTEADLNTMLSAVLATMKDGEIKFLKVAAQSGAILSGGVSACRLYRAAAKYGHASFFSYGTVLMEKTLLNGTWNPLEWVNPPMEVGVEYRTTERYDGKPIYAKIVNFGALPNATYKTVNLGISGGQKLVQWSATTSTGSAIPYTDNSSTMATWMLRVKNINAETVTIESTGNYSALTATVLVKYTKSTD